jgi:Short C-terminal domain
METKMNQLAKLKELLDMGALTQDEFDTQKARILASM